MNKNKIKLLVRLSAPKTEKQKPFLTLFIVHRLYCVRCDIKTSNLTVSEDSRNANASGKVADIFKNKKIKMQSKAYCAC